MSDKFATSLKSGVHSQLHKLIGDWEGTATVWFGPDTVADRSPVHGTMRPVLGGRFILHEYTGTFEGKPLEGIALFGFQLELGQVQSAWVDSFHNGTAIMFSAGKRGEKALSVLGSYAYVTPETEQHWGWRTEIDIVSDDEVILTAYNISPEGEETKATETAYKRVS